MKKALRKYGLMVLAAAICACGMQGCYVDSDCYTHNSCRQVCNYYYCWDECSEHYICEDDYDYRPGGNAQCYSNRDCGNDSYCEDGRCYQYKSGDVPFCGNCNVTGDCMEQDAKCVTLDDNQQVCMRYCESNNDCPNGYSCLDMTAGTSSGQLRNKQCYPDNGSCDSSYCRNDNDCVQNADCVNNRCVVPTTNMNECSQHSDCEAKYQQYGYCYRNKNNEHYCVATCAEDSHCEAGYSCFLTNRDNMKTLDSGMCLTLEDGKCVFNSDCGDGMVCNNSKCALSCSRNEDCVSDANAGKYQCIGSICQLAI